MITALRNRRLGCHVRGEFVGAIMYADDLLLLSASVIDLQKMLDVCGEVGKSLGITFNQSKSACMLVGPNKISTPASMFISGRAIDWKESIKYLGVNLKSAVKFSVDLNEVRRKFFVAVNSVMNHCSHTSDLIKLELLEKHCLPIILYCVESFNLDNYSLSLLNSWWNSVYRKIFKFHKWESVKNLICLLDRLDLHHMVYFRRVAFFKNLEQTDNKVMGVLFNNLKFSPEFYDVMKLHNVDFKWSVNKIKFKIYESYRISCLS
jgi:hypothetical protein